MNYVDTPRPQELSTPMVKKDTDMECIFGSGLMKV